MEKLRVFICDDKDSMQIESEIREMLKSFSLDCEVSVATSYLEAKKLVFEKRFDLFSLGDFADADYFMNADRFISMISSFNPGAIIFFLFNEHNYFSNKYDQKMAHLFLYKDDPFNLPRRMFRQDGVASLRQSLISKGFLDFKIPYDNLVDAVCVTRRHDDNVYLLIINKIKKLGIKYYAVDEGDQFGIFVESKDLIKIKGVAERIMKIDRFHSRKAPVDNPLLYWAVWILNDLKK